MATTKPVELRWYDHVAVQFGLGALAFLAVTGAHEPFGFEDRYMRGFCYAWALVAALGAWAGVRDNPLFAMGMIFGTFLTVLGGAGWLLLSALGLVVGI